MARIIHIDGPDKTGKDSIRREVVRNSEGTAMVYVRSFLSQIVYSRLYSRDIDESWFLAKWKLAYNLGEEFYFTDCSYEMVKERFILHNEMDLDIKDWKNHRSVFHDVLKKAEEIGIGVRLIDTTHDTIAESALRI
jgi:thymidylate kinase